MDHLQAPNLIEEILSTPDALGVEGAKEIKLTDSTGFIDALRGGSNADEPLPEVYEWRTTKLPDHEIMPMSTTKDVVACLRQRVEADSAKLGSADEPSFTDLDDYRAHLIAGNEQYAELFQKAPHLFRMIVSGKCTPRTMERIMELIALRSHQETAGQTLDEKQQQVSAHFRRHFMRKAREGEEEAAVRAGTGFSGTAMTAEQVRAELGGKTQ